MMNRVAYAETTVETPVEKLKRSKKYQTVEGIPESPLDNADVCVAPGYSWLLIITLTNSFTTKNSAKNMTNFTTTERKMKPRATCIAEIKILKRAAGIAMSLTQKGR